MKEDFAISQKELEIALEKVGKVDNGSSDQAEEIKIMKSSIAALEKSGKAKDARVKELEMETKSLKETSDTLRVELQDGTPEPRPM